MSYLKKLEEYSQALKIPSELSLDLKKWHASYLAAAAANGYKAGDVEPILTEFLELVVSQLKHPYTFESFHQRIKKPIDLYAMSLNFVRPLVKKESSKALHLEHANQIKTYLDRHENVILLANHQTELDPQAISLLLEETHPEIAENMIFVAGHRVITDPLAVPFSKGCNLLCIFSKKYIEDDPSKKEERRLHNQKTMHKLAQLLSEGGKCIYVAPSGGRDRRNSKGLVEVAKFDPQSIELFWLTTQRATKTTHFYPLTLVTYPLLPPPDTIRKNIGEPRHTQATPIFLSFGDEIDMEHLGQDISDKKKRREFRAHVIWEQVKKDHQFLVSLINE